MESTSTYDHSRITQSLSSASEMETFAQGPLATTIPGGADWGNELPFPKTRNPFVQAGALSTDSLSLNSRENAIDGGVDQLKESCAFIPLCQILKATNNFDDALVIGAGGFGKVYEGIIDDGGTTTVVAIKRLSVQSKQGAEEFWTEVELLSKLRHTNLVSLIGYCNENQEMILVYEHMARGTLADHLYKRSREESGGSRSHLTWEQRLNICLDAARGLDYLHNGNGTLPGIIHRDVKSTNILLDDHLVAKVSDLGLSKSTTTHTATHVSTCVKGTIGYLDPDYFMTGRLTKKSDVYALGVVLLEVFCGRPPIDRRLNDEEFGLARWAQMNIKEGTLDRIIDPSLNGDTTPDSLKYFAELANKCLHIQPKERPTMTEVVKSLQIALGSHERQGRSQGTIAKAWTLGGLLSQHRNPLLVPPNEIQKSSPKERPAMTEVVKSLQIAMVSHERQGRSQGTIAKVWTLGGLLSRHRNPLLVPPNEIQKSSIPANGVGKPAKRTTMAFLATISKAFDDFKAWSKETFMIHQENIVKKEEGFINEHLPDHVFANSMKNEDKDETVVYNRKGIGNSMELKHWATFKKLEMDPGNKNNRAYQSGVLLSNSKKEKKIKALKRLRGSLIPILGLEDYNTPLSFQALSGLSNIFHGLLSGCGDGQIILLNTNHIDTADVALQRPSSPQPKPLPDGGEIVLLDSSEQKPSVGFDATNNRAYQSDVLLSNSEEKNTGEASRRWCMPEGVLSLVDSTTSISSTYFDAPDNSAHFVREYQSGPIVFNSEKKDTGKGLNRECLTKSALSLDDSAKPRPLPDFDATEDIAVKVYARRGRGCWHPMGFEQRTTLEELGMDPENEGIISDLLRFVRDKEELYKDAGKDWKRGYLLYDSPGTGRSSLIAAMANFLEFDIYHLDLMGLTTISELTNVLVSIRNRSVIAIKNFDQWDGKLPDFKTELTLSGLSKIIHGLLSSCGDEQIIVLTTNHNHIDRVEVTLLRPLNIDLYIHTSSPQLKALPDGGEIVLLDSSEQKPSVDFYATDNRAYQSDVLLSNSEEKNMREASRRQCMPERVLSLVDSTARISSTDFDASDNRAHLVRAYQSGPVVFNSEKKDTGEGLSRECLTKSVLSLDDSSKQKSLSDDAVTEKKSHLVRAYQSGPVVSLSDDKNRGEPLKRECFNKSIFGIDDLQQHSGGRRDDAAKSFCEARIIHIFSSLELQAFDATNAHLVKADERGPTVSNSEKGCMREAIKRDCLTNALSLEDLQQHFGARRKDAAKGLCDSPAWKSFEVLDSLPLEERSNNIRHLARQRALTHTHCVRLKKSQDLLRSLQRDCSGGLASQSDIGLPDGEHILSLLKKKIARKTLKRKGRTMSVLSLEDQQEHFGSRSWEDAVKFLGSKRICRQLAIHSETTAKRIGRQLGTRRWPFKQSAIGFPDGGHILSLSEKKIVRKTLKRKCRNTSVLSLEDHKQHVDRWWEDAAKSHGAKRFCRELGIHHLSTAKRTHKQHGIHQWPFQRSAIGLPDGQHVLPLSEKKMVRKTLKRKCRSMSVLSLVDRQRHVDRRWKDATKNIGAKRICRQLVIHRVSIAKRICRQHGIHRWWPFERDWATMKGYSLGDERPVEVISLSTHAKLVPRLQLIYISWLGRFSPRPLASAGGGEIGGPIALSLSESAATKNIAQRVGQDQSGSAASDSENERTREQGDPDEINATITLHDIRRHYGKRNREDAAASLAISVATFKRKCREFGIKRWPHVRKRKVGRPPDQHGEGNRSTAHETPSHHVQTAMGGEPVGQNQEANVLRQDFMGGPIALNIDSGLIMVVRPPDQHGEKNTSIACEVPSHNVDTGMEIEPVGQNQEANVFRRDFTEGPTALNTENGLIIGSSSERASQVNDQSTLSTPYQNHNAPVFPQPQITSMLSENRGGSIDWGNSSASQAEPFSDTHISGSSNLAFPTWSDQAAPSQHVEGQSMQSTVYPDHNAVHRFPEGHVFESINWNEHTNSLASQAEPFSDRLISRSIWRPPDLLEGQTMQFTAHPNPNALGLPQFQIASSQVPSANEATPSQPVAAILTERQGPRSVKVKATYGNGNRIIKFPLPLTSGIKELMQELSKTLDWELGSFDVDYKDEDGDWILMARDDNVSEYLQLLNSLGNQAAKLEVRKKVPDTMNICETCGSLKQ